MIFALKYNAARTPYAITEFALVCLNIKVILTEVADLNA